MLTLKDFLKKDNFAQNSGIELIEAKIGYAKAQMLVTSKHLNAGGVCQGGALFTLADVAFAAVANSRTKLTFSISANITFLRPAHLGYVYAEAHEIGNNQHIPFIEVRITNESNDLIAIMTSSGYRKDINLPIESLLE